MSPALFIFLSSLVLITLVLLWMKNEKARASEHEPPKQLIRRPVIRPAKTIVILRCAGEMPKVRFSAFTDPKEGLGGRGRRKAYLATRLRTLLGA